MEVNGGENKVEFHKPSESRYRGKHAEVKGGGLGSTDRAETILSLGKMWRGVVSHPAKKDSNQ